MSNTNSTVTTTTASTASATQQAVGTTTNNNGNGQMQNGQMQGGMFYPPPPPPLGPECFDEYGRPNGQCGPLGPPPQYIPVSTNNQTSNDKGYIKYVLPVIGVLFIIAVFGVYLYLLTNKKKKKKYNNNNNNMSYSLPKISVDDKDAAQAGNDYINKLGQYKTPVISDYDSAYRSPVAGSLSSFNMTQPGYNGLNGVGMGNISMGNLSSAAYLGTQPIMVDPLYETSLNYSMKGQRKQVGNKSLNNVSRYAGSDIGVNPSVGDPLSNLMLSPIEPTNFNVNTSKPY